MKFKFQIPLITLIVLFLATSCMVGLNFTPRRSILTRVIHFDSHGTKYVRSRIIVQYGWPYSCLIKVEEPIGPTVSKDELVTTTMNSFEIGWQPYFIYDLSLGLTFPLLVSTIFQVLFDVYKRRKIQLTVPPAHEKSG